MKTDDEPYQILYPIASTDLQSYRVILREHEDSTQHMRYEIWTGNGVIRYLYPNEMPKEMANKLVVTKAYGGGDWHREDIGSIFSALPYVPTCPIEYREIGWRISKDYYCLVLTPQTLNLLRGTTLHDPGSENKETSKGNS